MLSFAFEGLVAAPFTPFHPDGSLWLAQIPRLADDLVSKGVTGAFICGTTGEGTSLTVSERQTVAATWVKAARGRLKVAVHVGHLCLADSRDLASHAHEVGADAIATCGPFFYPIRQVEQLVSALVEVAAAAPDLPFYYYHIPQLTHLGHLSMVDLLCEGARRIPTLRGVKYTHNDLEEYAKLLALNQGGFDTPFGRDEILLSGLVAGAKGAIGSTFNFAAEFSREVFAAQAKGDIVAAREWQCRTTELVGIMRTHGGLAAMKQTMRHIGLDCGPVRLPLRQPSLPDADKLSLALERWGLPRRPAK
jgi:N-acetylneuraminate lyase